METGNKIFIDKTHKSPLIEGDVEAGSLIIEGKSIPEDAKEFYLPLLNWALQLQETSASEIKVVVDLEYFNTSTSSILLSLFKLLEKTNEKIPTKITWKFEEDDLDMEEVGEDYQLMIPEIISLEAKPV